MPGASGSRGSEVQNFCYDEQNRLVWSGNGGTQPGVGNGTCGSGTLSSGLIGAGYTAPYTYTNLGQIWQGPVNGTGTTRQYLSCSSSHPHQLTGIYPTGTTCSGLSGALYTASYDAWGNETGRTYNSTTATLSYDALNRLVKYSAGSSQEFSVYDANGSRVLKRSISGGSTTLTAYVYGQQELTYTGTGAFSSQIDYYSLAGHLIGSTNGTSTTYDLTDAQGSVLTTLSASAVVGEQVYGPYGNQRYIQGTLGTDKGYTGQFTDAVTGLDYYNARYYDPVMAQFLSADHVQGNVQGMDPYAYVAGNPETATDPTGHVVIDGGVGNTIAQQHGNKVNKTPFEATTPTCSRGYMLQGGSCVRDHYGYQPASCTKTSGPKACTGAHINSDPVSVLQQKHNQQSKAYTDAVTTQGDFQHWSDILGGDTFWMAETIVGFIFFYVGNMNGIFGGMLAGIVTGIITALAYISLLLSKIIKVFAGETSNGPGAFTQAHLEADRQQLEQTTMSLYYKASAVNLFMVIGGAIACLVLCTGEGNDGALNSTAQAFSTAAVAQVAEAAATGWLDWIAESAINQEESDLA